MRTHVLAIIGFIGAALVFLIMFVGLTDVAPLAVTLPPRPHLYANWAESIADIQVTAVYFAPRDITPVLDGTWQDLLEQELSRLQEFHTVQFRGFSRITYAVHPSPIVGREAHAAYDIDILHHNDQQVLRPIAEEVSVLLGLELNVGPPYNVLLVLYEGAGAGGSNHMSLISRNFFERPDTREVAGTFLAHEFYHALGVPDGYRIVPKVFPDGSEVDTELLQTWDIMGRVRIPLEETYLSPATLTAMGL